MITCESESRNKHETAFIIAAAVLRKFKSGVSRWTHHPQQDRKASRTCRELYIEEARAERLGLKTCVRVTSRHSGQQECECVCVKRLFRQRVSPVCTLNRRSKKLTSLFFFFDKCLRIWCQRLPSFYYHGAVDNRHVRTPLRSNDLSVNTRDQNEIQKTQAWKKQHNTAKLSDGDETELRNAVTFKFIRMNLNLPRWIFHSVSSYLLLGLLATTCTDA